MKTKRKLILIALMYGLFIMISCMPGGQTALFRQMKKEADTLIVISPYLEILADDFREKSIDHDLQELNRQLITKVTSDVLSSRYVLKHIELPEIDENKLFSFYDSLDNSTESNAAAIQQPLFSELKEIDKSKLAMFITYHAEYNSVAAPVSSQSNFGTSTLTVNPSARPRSDLRLIVINLQTDEVVFYNRHNTRNYSPNIPNDIEQITRRLLKDIYYK